MAKKKNKKIIPSESLDFNVFKFYKINLDKTIIYRCKYCRKSCLEKNDNKIYRLSGHARNCPIIKNKKFVKEKNCLCLKNKESKYSFCSNKSKKNIIETKFNYKSEIACEITKTNDSFFSKEEFEEFTIDKKMKIFKLFINVFDRKNRLNKYQYSIGTYYINNNKIIGEGKYSTCFIEEDIYQRMNVAILRMNKC